MEQKRYDIIIVGGGISGLSLAYLLAEMDREVLVIEKTKRAGGAIESIKYEDFSIDLGSHTCYNSYTSLSQLLTNAPTRKQIVERTRQKYYFATHEGFRKLTYPIHWTDLFLHIPNVFTTKQEGKSVREYYSKILGEKNFQNFAQHFFKAVLCQNAENYPAAFFLKKRKQRNKEFPKSFTFQNGMQTLINNLKQHPRVTVQYDFDIERIEQKETFCIKGSQRSFESKSLAFATYAGEASRLLSDSNPTLSDVLKNIAYTAVSSLGIIVKKEDSTSIKPFAGLLTKSDSYTSIVARDILPNKSYRGFTIHAQGNISPEKLRTLLCQNLRVSSSIILKEKYKKNHLPQLKEGHENLLEAIHESLEKIPNLYLTGNYFQGLSLEDCVRRSQKEALRYISTL